MSIIQKLSSSLGRHDQKPNEELAMQIVATADATAISELIENLGNKGIQSDCIKVLYEIGAKEPKLIAQYAKEFILLLESKNNRLQWGAMTALDTIAHLKPKLIFPALGKIIAVANAGSVITRDHAVGILIKLMAVKEYSEKSFALLLTQLQTAPTNQLPMYAENAFPFIEEKNQAAFGKILTSRLNDIEKDTKRKRVEKVIKKLTAK